MAGTEAKGTRKQHGSLLSVLQREHQEVDRQLGALLSTDDADERAQIWDGVYAMLHAHAHAEQERVYPALGDDLGALVQHAVDEHNVFEAMMIEIDHLAPDESEFDREVQRLRQTVQEHVEDEEQVMLPTAHLSAERDREITRAFEQRRDEILEEQRRTRGAERREQEDGGDGRRRRGGRAERLSHKSREELYQMAQDRHISGRSKMKRDQLVEALSAEDTQPG
jgi:hypothetical protein